MTSDDDRRRWAAAAERYGAGWTQAAAPDLGWIVEAVAPTGSETALDVGCGAGHATRMLAPCVASMTGIDPTPEMLAVARRLADETGLGDVRFVQATAAALPFGDGSAQIAISRYSVHHWPDPVAGFREIARVLASGGRLAIVDMVAPPPGAVATLLSTLEMLRDPGHAHSLSAEEWLALLGSAGFAAAITRRWEVRHDTEKWLDQTDPPAWHRAAVRELLREAGPAAREALAIEPDGAAFAVGAGLISAVRG